MHSRRPVMPLLAAALAAVALTGSAASSTSFKITSTLDGMTALPHRIQWLATVHGAKAREVDFLIDGKLRWVHHHLPYYYGDFSESLGNRRPRLPRHLLARPRACTLHRPRDQHERADRQ